MELCKRALGKRVKRNWFLEVNVSSMPYHCRFTVLLYAFTSRLCCFRLCGSKYMQPLTAANGLVSGSFSHTASAGA